MFDLIDFDTRVKYQPFNYTPTVVTEKIPGALAGGQGRRRRKGEREGRRKAGEKAGEKASARSRSRQEVSLLYRCPSVLNSGRVSCSASNSIPISSSVPVEIRRQCGRPNVVNWRTITPRRNNPSNTSRAASGVSIGTITKFASDGTGCSPRPGSVVIKLRIPRAFNSSDRCSHS